MRTGPSAPLVRVPRRRVGKVRTLETAAPTAAGVPRPGAWGPSVVVEPLSGIRTTCRRPRPAIR
jgi:hypothetical protein